MSIHDFLEQLPPEIKNLAPVRAMANLISQQTALIQQQSEKILTLQKTINELKGEVPQQNKNSDHKK